MDIEQALLKLGKVAPFRQLSKYGISRSDLSSAVNSERVIRIRNGWYALPIISHAEFAAISMRGFLTCASAASIRNLPTAASHFHIRSRVVGQNASANLRRRRPQHHGALVSVPEMIIDYLHCQPNDWSTALVDAIESQRLLSSENWEMVRDLVPNRLKKIVDARSSLPESPLESITRYRLSQAKIRHSMQVSIGRFRADFVLGPGLILETHGAEHHSSKADWESDKRRVAWFRSQGWDVLELTFAQIMEWDEALHAIRRLISRQKR